jgi:hypothetical protein
MASVTLDLVTHNNAQPASPAVHLEDRTASTEILSEWQPEFAVPAPGSGSGLADLGYRPGAQPVAGGVIFQRKGSPPAAEIYTDKALLLATSDSTGSRARRRSADQR